MNDKIVEGRINAGLGVIVGLEYKVLAIDECSPYGKAHVQRAWMESVTQRCKQNWVTRKGKGKQPNTGPRGRYGQLL
ncbi:hypothetical protein Knedl_CDS0032 [Pseudomonas phage Knedl]|nr:hypothetical protein Knedl_CDS0032 [Pseudomonas phage Knedl]